MDKKKLPFEIDEVGVVTGDFDACRDWIRTLPQVKPRCSQICRGLDIFVCGSHSPTGYEIERCDDCDRFMYDEDAVAWLQGQLDDKPKEVRMETKKENYVRLLLKTFETDSSGFALVDITNELRREILGYRELFQMVKSKAPELENLRLSSYCVFFYEENTNLDPDLELDLEDERCRLKPLLGPREYCRFNCREVLVVPNNFGDNLHPLEGETANPNERCTDYDTLVISKEGFWWEGWADTGVISTTTIEYGKLLSNFSDC